MRSLIPRLFPRFLLRRLLLRRLLLLLGFLLFGLFRSRGGFGDSDGREIVPFFSKDGYNLTHWDFLGTRLDDDLAHHAIFLRFHIDRRLVRLLHLSLALNKRDKKERMREMDLQLPKAHHQQQSSRLHSSSTTRSRLRSW